MGFYFLNRILSKSRGLFLVAQVMEKLKLFLKQQRQQKACPMPTKMPTEQRQQQRRRRSIYKYKKELAGTLIRPWDQAILPRILLKLYFQVRNVCAGAKQRKQGQILL